MGQQVERLWHKDTDLKNVDVVVLPGGFSYGDYLRSGAIARFSPIMNEVIGFANKGGRVFGVCNGFQILCESGLLPGALLHNSNQQFICKNIHLEVSSTDSFMTNKAQKGQVLQIPIAHAEGRYHNSEDELKKLEDADQVLFRYCDAQGNVSESMNPNGSKNNIAGVTNSMRNVIGMMPHPERAADAELRNEDGKILFESILDGVLV